MNTSSTIESSLQVNWPLPLALVLVLYAAFLALAVWLYSSERGSCSRWLRGVMAVLRFSLLVLVVWMLAGWNWLRVRTEPPELVIAVDVSESMQTNDGASSATGSNSVASNSPAQTTRLQRAQQLLRLTDAQLADLNSRYHLRLYAVADDALQVNSQVAVAQEDLAKLTDSNALDFKKNASRLGDSLSRIVQRQAGRGTAAIVFFSDGITTSGTSLSDAAERARRAAIPIQAITLGRQSAQPDLRVTDLLCEDRVYLGDRVTIDATIAASEVQDQSVSLNLLDTATGKVLAQKSVRVSSAQSQQTVQLEFIPDKPGELKLKVSLDPLPGEINVANNSIEHPIVVENRTIKVLLVFGSPSYEFRFLKHFLERSTENSENRSASFELKSVLQDGDLDYVLQDSSAQRFVPSDTSVLEEFDAFVFGQFEPNIIPRGAQQAIVRAVTQGGAGCIFVAADGSFVQRLSGTPLASLLPVESAEKSVFHGAFSVASTKLGESSLPLQWASSAAERSGIGQKLPALQSILRVQGLKPGAQVLAEAVSNEDEHNPLLISQFAGAGRSVLLATDETYRWTGAFGSDAIHQTFWGQTLRWISRGKLSSLNQAELLVEPKQSVVGSPVRLRLRLPAGISLPEAATVRLSSSDGGVRSETLARIAGTSNSYQCILNQLGAGNYRAVVTSPTLTDQPAVDFSVTSPPGEQANLQADSAAMKQLAVASRGKQYDDSNAGDWLKELPAGRPTRLGSLPPEPIWNSAWIAALFVGLITAEWLLRRHARLM